eukprot:354140-Chlamydomonas_euryale.AAC.4
MRAKPAGAGSRRAPVARLARLLVASLHQQRAQCARFCRASCHAGVAACLAADRMWRRCLGASTQGAMRTLAVELKALQKLRECPAACAGSHLIPVAQSRAVAGLWTVGLLHAPIKSPHCGLCFLCINEANLFDGCVGPCTGLALRASIQLSCSLLPALVHASNALSLKVE